MKVIKYFKDRKVIRKILLSLGETNINKQINQVFKGNMIHIRIDMKANELLDNILKDTRFERISTLQRLTYDAGYDVGIKIKG